MKGYLIFGVAAIAAGAAIAEVTFKQTTTVLPTYAPGGYDKTPLFYTGRVYQGAQGRVYPYPMQDVLHDEKIDETYTYLSLQNDWLQMGILPEHGGHMLNFTDRQTGFETFYRQHVVKPALIGMLGAWISGGVEWNFPHHHRATTAMPIDWRMTERDPKEPNEVAPAAGTKTVWIGETELRRRLKWTIGLSMMPDRAVLMAENIFMNRQPWIESMIYWANVSVHCGDDYQILFPPSCHLGFDHHKNYWTSFPIGPRKEEVELLPSQRSKYADDISGMMDLSWWKNFTIESRSIFAMDPDNAWLAGYDHKKQCGTAHVSNRHITVGKKFFLWGNFPEAHVWDTVLTDKDGPYLELMVGCWSDNQPDYSWIAPYETRKVKQFWFPVKGIGGVKNVTIDGAVNVDRRGADELLVGFYSTRVLTNCTVRVVRGQAAVFTESHVSLDPNKPWCKPVKVATDAKDQEFTAMIADADGKTFLAYTPVGPDPHDPLPPKVENPKEPKEYASAELAYEVGLRLDQFHNGLIDPEPYYKRALEIDPDYSKANLALGVRLAKNGAYAAAKPYLERAVKRVTQNHTRALDAAPEYYLALCCRGLGDYKRAEDLFWRCTWRQTHKKESFFEIVRLCCLQGRYREAHDILEFSLMPLGMDEAKVHTLHAYLHRKLKDHPDALPMQRANWQTLAANNQKKAFVCDPLEYWGQCEETFREGGDGDAALAKAEVNRGLKAQQLMETVCDYWGIGAWDEVIALCDAALAKAATEKPYATEGALPLKDTLAACNSYRNPMFAYFAANAVSRHAAPGKSVKDYLAKAESMCGDYCFPSRLEELAVLKWAATRLKSGCCYKKTSSSNPSKVCGKPGKANTFYYLGEILWNLDQKDEGLAAWRMAVAHNPKHALAWRCLGFALSHPGTYFTNTGVPSGIASRDAYDCYLKALEADPENFRTLDEAGKLAEKLNLPAKERLALMLKHPKACAKYDACILRLAYTYNAVGEFAKAHETLTTRRFHVWEGADGLLAPFVESCIGLGKAAMAKNDYKTALKYFEESTTYPANLQAGRPGDAGTEPKSRYFMAQCKKALGDEAGYRAELENSLKGWIHAGEMDYWRVKALRELGRDAECAPLLAELKQAIRELETPAPVVINAYAKFAGDNSAMERAAKAREKADFLRGLLNEIAPQATVSGKAKVTRIGAVNWDCSTPSFTFFGHHATKSLGPEKYRDRTPFYAKVVGKDKIDYSFRTVAEYEREMQYAIDAGIDYFAYCWYDKIPLRALHPAQRCGTADPHLHEITRARLTHVKSPLRDKLHLCAILVTCHDYSDDELADLATEMRENWYEKVEGRPLVYLFCGIGPIARLREICRRDGTPEPYAVLMDYARGKLVTDENRPQLQAICSYGYTGDGKDFATYVANAISANDARANVGLPAIPHFSTGWDPTPRIERPVPWANYPAGRPYQIARSADDFRLMANRLKTWMDANSEKCPTGHVMTFAWNEFEEGGWICPNLGEDGKPDTGRVKAFAEAVKLLKAE